MKPEEKLELFRKQLRIEEQIIEVASSAAESISNLMIKELIKGINTDSYKHSSMLRALIGLHEKPSLIKEETAKYLQKILEDHIRLEKEAIKTYGELMNILKDERERLVIEAILSDEKRHHALLTKIQKLIVEKQVFTQEDYWNWAWSNVEWGGGS